MKDNIKLAVKIGGKTLLTWVVTFGFGLLITSITFLIALYSNIDLFSSIKVLFLGLLFSNFYAFLLVFGAPIFIILYFIIANKTSIQNTIYLLWKGEMGNFISDKVGILADHLTEKRGWRKELSNKTLLKARLIQANKNDPNTSQLQRKVIKFGLKKIKLDDINFQDNNLRLSGILATKFNAFISETVNPTSKHIWTVVSIQIALLIASNILI